MEKVLFILGELDDDDIDWMLETGQRETIAAGTVLIREGYPTSALYILLEGALSISTAATGNRELALLTQGEVVGEMSFIDTRPPSATVTAKERSLVLAIPRDKLALKLRQDLGFSSRFYCALAIFLSERLRITVKQLGGYGLEETITLPEEELAKTAQDNVSIARTRLDWLLRRLREH